MTEKDVMEILMNSTKEGFKKCCEFGRMCLDVATLYHDGDKAWTTCFQDLMTTIHEEYGHPEISFTIEQLYEAEYTTVLLRKKLGL